MSARDRLVFSTIDLMRRHGVAGTGVAEILENGDVSRRSIYLNFPDGKVGLVAESARVAGDLIDAQIAAFVALPDPRDGLAAFVVAWKKVVTDSDFEAGCPVTAASLSRSSTPAVADVAGEAFDRWHATLLDSLHRHGVDDPAAQSFCTTVLAAVEGAVVMCIAQKSVTALDHVETQMALLLDHHLGSDR